jgi:hypothetical protein
MYWVKCIDPRFSTLVLLENEFIILKTYCFVCIILWLLYDGCELGCWKSYKKSGTYSLCYKWLRLRQCLSISSQDPQEAACTLRLRSIYWYKQELSKNVALQQQRHAARHAGCHLEEFSSNWSHRGIKFTVCSRLQELASKPIHILLFSPSNKLHLISLPVSLEHIPVHTESNARQRASWGKMLRLRTQNLFS